MRENVFNRNKLLISSIPFIILLIVVGVHSFGYTEMVVCKKGIIKCSDFSEARIFINNLYKKQSEYSVDARIQAYPYKLYWTTSVGLCIVFGLISLFYSLWAIKHHLLYFLDKRKSHYLLFTLLIIIPLVVVFLIIYQPAGANQPHTWRILSGQLIKNYFPSLDWLKPAVDGFSMFVSLYVAIGVTVILYSILSVNGTDEAWFLNQISVFKNILYLGAILLVVNVIRINFLLNWSYKFLIPELWSNETENILIKSYENLGLIINAIVFIQGLMYSLMLFALYIPTKLIIKLRIELLENSTDISDNNGPAEQVKKALSFSIGENMGGYFAILGPLISGPVVDLIANILSKI
jgi:hypothetical protein